MNTSQKYPFLICLMCNEKWFLHSHFCVVPTHVCEWSRSIWGSPTVFLEPLQCRYDYWVLLVHAPLIVLVTGLGPVWSVPSALISACLFLRSKASAEVQKQTNQNKTKQNRRKQTMVPLDSRDALTLRRPVCLDSCGSTRLPCDVEEHVSEALSNILSPRNWAGVAVEGCEWTAIPSGAHIPLCVLWVQVPNTFQIHFSNSALCFVWPRIRLTVQTQGAHKSKQSISKKNSLFKFNSRKVLESGVYNRAAQNKRLRLARTGKGHFRQGIMCLLLHLSNFKFWSFYFPFLPLSRNCWRNWTERRKGHKPSTSLIILI